MSSYSWPSAPSGANPSVAPVPGTAPTSATLVAGENAGLIVPLSTDASGDLNVNVVSSVPGVVTANQGAPAVIADAWPVEIVGAGNIANVTAAGAVQVDGSGVTQPVSAASLPLPTGASTSANQATEITALGTINTTLGSPFQAGGSIGNTSFVVTQPSGSSLHVDVDNFPATQPVSGTVAATQSGTWTVQPGNTANTTPWLITVQQGGNAGIVTAAGAQKVDGSAVTQPVSGTITANAGTGTFSENLTQVGGSAIALGQTTMSASIPVAIASNQSTLKASAATPTAGTITNAAITVGTTAVRLTVSGSAPSATRSVLVATPDTASTATFYIGTSSVTNSGATRGVEIVSGQSFIANSDAGDYWIVASAASQTVTVMEQA